MQQLAQNLMQTAMQLHQSGALHAAAEHCLQALSLVPEYPDALYFLAVLNAQQQMYVQAEEYFVRAIHADPTRAEFHGNYANALLQQNKLAQAIAQGKQSVALDPEQLHSHNILGNAYLLQGDYAMAVRYLQCCIQLNPQYAPAYNKLGVAFHCQQQYRAAIVHFQKALALQTNYLEALRNLGQTLQASGDIAGAYASYQKVLAINPEDKQAHYGALEVSPAWLAPLTGSRLRLRRFQVDDSEFLLNCYAQAEFMRFYHQSIAQQQAIAVFVQKLQHAAQQHPCQSKAIDWVILKLAADGAEQPIGVANLVDIQFPNRRAEFLIGIPDATQRAGHAAVEASLLVMEFAFNRVQLNKLTSFVYAYNPQAQKNTLALGFTQEGLLREQLLQPATGRLLDLYSNGLTLADFRSNKRLARLAQRLLGRDVTLPQNPLA